MGQVAGRASQKKLITHTNKHSEAEERDSLESYGRSQDLPVSDWPRSHSVQQPLVMTVDLRLDLRHGRSGVLRIHSSFVKVGQSGMSPCM